MKFFWIAGRLGFKKKRMLECLGYKSEIFQYYLSRKYCKK